MRREYVMKEAWEQAWPDETKVPRPAVSEEQPRKRVKYCVSRLELRQMSRMGIFFSLFSLHFFRWIPKPLFGTGLMRLSKRW